MSLLSSTSCSCTSKHPWSVSLTHPYTSPAAFVVLLLSNTTLTSVALSRAIGRPLIRATLCFHAVGYTSIYLFHSAAPIRSGQTLGSLPLLQGRWAKTGTFCGQRCGPVIGISGSAYNIACSTPIAVRVTRPRVGARVAAACGERVALVKGGLTRRVVVVVVKRQRNAALMSHARIAQHPTAAPIVVKVAK